MDKDNIVRKGKFKSRPHSKKEKREQRKRWKKRKQKEYSLAKSKERSFNVPQPAKNPKVTEDALNKQTMVSTGTQVHGFKEIDPSLLVPLKDNKIGCGTFGECYLAQYQGEFLVAVKQIKTSSDSIKENEKQDVITEIRCLQSIDQNVDFSPVTNTCA